MIIYLSEQYLISFRLLIEILFEKFEPAVTEKFEVEFRYKSLRLHHSISGLSGLWCNEPAETKFDQIQFFGCENFDCEPHDGNQTCGYGETTFR